MLLALLLDDAGNASFGRLLVKILLFCGVPVVVWILKRTLFDD